MSTVAEHGTSKSHAAADAHPIRPFAERYRSAIGNPRLASNVTRYQRNWRVNRDKSLEEIEFEELRARFKATKTKVQDRLDEYLAEPLPAATPNSVTDPTRLRERLGRIRRDGYAWTDQELDLEVNGLAAPIVDDSGALVAVATLYGPSYRFAETLTPRLGEEFAALVRSRT